MSEEDEGMEPVEPEAGQTSPPRDRRWYWVVASLLPIVFLAGIFGFGLGRDPTRSPSVLVGKPAPDFALRDLRTGKVITLASLRGHPVVVNFWATWCPPCREEMPALQRVAASEPDVVVLEVDLMEPGDKARSFLDSLGLDRLQPVLDTDGATTRRYGVLSLPSTFFVDKDGVIRHLELSAVTETQIRNGIRKAR